MHVPHRALKPTICVKTPTTESVSRWKLLTADSQDSAGIGDIPYFAVICCQTVKIFLSDLGSINMSPPWSIVFQITITKNTEQNKHNDYTC